MKNAWQRRVVDNQDCMRRYTVNSMSTLTALLLYHLTNAVYTSILIVCALKSSSINFHNNNMHLFVFRNFVPKDIRVLVFLQKAATCFGDIFLQTGDKFMFTGLDCLYYYT